MDGNRRCGSQTLSNSPLLGPQVTLLKRFDQVIESDLQRLIVGQDWRYLAPDIEELVDRHLGDPDRIFHREDHVLRYLHELADERQVPRTAWHRRGPVTLRPRHEHASD